MCVHMCIYPADETAAVPSNVADHCLGDAAELCAVFIGHVHRLELLFDPLVDGFVDVRAVVLIEQHVTQGRAELCCENLAVDGVGSRVSREGDSKQSRFGKIAVRERHRNVVRHDHWWERFGLHLHEPSAHQDTHRSTEHEGLDAMHQANPRTDDGVPGDQRSQPREDLEARLSVQSVLVAVLVDAHVGQLNIPVVRAVGRASDGPNCTTLSGDAHLLGREAHREDLALCVPPVVEHDAGRHSKADTCDPHPERELRVETPNHPLTGHHREGDAWEQERMTARCASGDLDAETPVALTGPKAVGAEKLPLSQRVQQLSMTVQTRSCDPPSRTAFGDERHRPKPRVANPK